MKIRLIEETDMEMLLDAERAFNLVKVSDLDFGDVEWLNPWTLSANDILAIIRQRPRKDLGTYDTRTFVAEVGLEATDEQGFKHEVPWVVGGFAYEIQENAFEVVFLTIHPVADVPAVMAAMLDFLKKKAERSDNRNRVTLYLRDRDEAGLRQLLPLIKLDGFTVKLARDHFGDHDGWECSYVAPSQVEETCGA